MSEPQSENLGPHVRTLQIIVASLVMGVILFGGYVVLFAPAQAKPGANGQILTLLSMVVGASGLVLSPLIAGIMARAQIRGIASGTWQPSQPGRPAPDTDAGRLAIVYSTKTIVGAALCEGPCLLALVAYLVERQWPALLAAGVLVAALLWHLPTYDRVSNWIEDGLRQVAEARRFR
jgi:hypothetical protein